MLVLMNVNMYITEKKQGITKAKTSIGLMQVNCV